MDCLCECVKMTSLLILLLIQTGLVASTPLPQEVLENERDGKGFIGFSFFAPPERVEPHHCLSTNGLLPIGTCYNKQSCIEAGGSDAGSCATGGVCCVIPVRCGGTIARNRTWFVNEDYPDKSRDSGECTITIQKSLPRVKQVRLDFDILKLDGPRRGRCLGDMFAASNMVDVNGRQEEVDMAPRLCGDNSGQHVYLNMEKGDVKIHVKLDSGSLSRGASPPREWRILVSQLDSANAAPDDCLQYHREASSEVQSLNFGAADDFRDDLNYDICFSKLDRSAKDEDSCKRKFTNVEIEQPDSYRQQKNLRRRKMKRNKNNRMARSAETAEGRELPARSPPAQSLPDKDVVLHDAFSDVISQISKTVEEVRTETDQDKNENNSMTETIYPVIQNQEKNDPIINFGKDQTDDTEATMEENPNYDDIKDNPNYGDDVLPMLYSAGNEAVISQIHQVVLQLQQEQQLGMGGISMKNDEDSFIFDVATEGNLESTTSTFFNNYEPEETDELNDGISKGPEYTEANNSDVTEEEIEDSSNNDQNIKPDILQSQGIDQSINSVSDIVNAFLISNTVSTTTDAPEPFTDNLAVEGFIIETLLTPEGTPVESSVAQTKDAETLQENEVVTSEMPTSNENVKEPDSNSISMLLENEGEVLLVEDPHNIINEENSAGENHEEHPLDNKEGNVNMNNQDSVTEAYNNIDVVSSTSSEINILSNDAIPIETIGNEAEVESPQAEITVLDPESVQIHGDLVIKDHSSDNDDENSDGGDVSTKVTTEKPKEIKNDASSGNMDDLSSSTVYVNEDFIAATTEMTEMMNPILDSEMDSKLPEVDKNEEEEEKEENNQSQSTSNNSGEDKPNDDIQWLILEGTSTDEEKVNDPVLALPPEVVISSDIGFGINNENGENNLPSVQTEDKNASTQSSGNTEEESIVGAGESVKETVEGNSNRITSEENVDVTTEENISVTKSEVNSSTNEGNINNTGSMTTPVPVSETEPSVSDISIVKDNDNQESGNNDMVNASSDSFTLLGNNDQPKNELENHHVMTETELHAMTETELHALTKPVTMDKTELHTVAETEPNMMDGTELHAIAETEPNTMDETELHAITETGLNTMDETELNAMAETEPDKMDETELHVMAESGPDTTDETKLYVMAETEPDTIDETKLHVMAETEPDTIDETELHVMAETGPDTMDETKLHVMAETEPDTIDETEYHLMAETEPDTMDKTEIHAVTETGIDIMDEAILDAVVETELNAMDETEINAMDETKINAMAETILNAIAETEHILMPETEVNGMTETEHNGMPETEVNGMTETEVDEMADPDDPIVVNDETMGQNGNTEDVLIPDKSEAIPENDAITNSNMAQEDTPVDDPVVEVSVDDSSVGTEDIADINVSDNPLTPDEDNDMDDNIVDNSNVDDNGSATDYLPAVIFPSDEEQCGGSFLQVRDNIICGALLRQEPIEDEQNEDDRFKDVERISVRSLESARRSLRFELQYETDCPEEKVVTTTPKPPVRKTVTLLQYLLGWYR